MKQIKLGSNAPTFKLLNQNSEWVDLKLLKGKTIVLYFYPKALTPGCTAQACGIRDHQKVFSKLNVTIFGISPDEPKKLLKFIEKEKLNFDLLSDVDHVIAEKYGVWGLKKFMGKEYMGVKRVTFIISDQGKILHVIEDVKTKSHHDDLISILRTLL